MHNEMVRKSMVSGLLRIGRLELWAYRMISSKGEYHSEEGMWAANYGPIWLLDPAGLQGIIMTEMYLCVGPVQVRLGRSVLQ